MNNYLFALQNAREGWASFLMPLLVLISEFAYYGVLVVTLLLYLCVDKKKYEPILFTACIGNFITNFIKICACIYRPWISDSRLYVAEAAKKTATGYAFPSGHTTAATGFYGGIAQVEYKNKKRVGIICLMVVLTLLTAFSRNFLGAHTLKDVVVAMIIAVLVLALTHYMLIFVEKNPNGDKILLITLSVLSIAAMIFAIVKSYPMDLDASGQLLADPVKMKGDTIQSCGFLLGVAICWFIDRKYINFTTDVTTKRKIVRGIIVAVAFLFLYMFLLRKLAHAIDPNIGAFLRSFLSVIICVGVYPALFTKWEKNH